MSYEDLLTDECEIYHLKSRSIQKETYGVPIDKMQQEHHYDEQPDLNEVACYFIQKSQSIVQGEPNRTINEFYNVHFEIDTDIRVNSKVVWEGVSYKAQKPKKIKDHHIEVALVRSDSM